jgi:hypothetical protein
MAMGDEEMDRLFSTVERNLGSSWSDAVEHIRDSNDLTAIEAKLAAGNFDGAVDEIESAAKKFANAVKNNYVISGSKAAKALAEKADTPIVFDPTNTRAIKAMEYNSMDLVRSITKDQKAMIRQVINTGLINREAPAEMARTIYDSIGLTQTQEQHVANYRAQLESNNSTELAASLQRELRDGRYDKAVKKAIETGEPLSQDRIDKMVDLYRDSYVRLRSQTIARTEALRVTHQGTQELYAQAIENGDVDEGDLVRTWHTGPNARDSHAAMNGQKRGMNEPFDTGGGYTLMYPGDPSAPGKETINCNCVVSTRYVAPSEVKPKPKAPATQDSDASASTVDDDAADSTAPTSPAAQPVSESELEDHRQSFANRTTADEQGAAYTYSTRMYQDINSHLRGLYDDNPLTGSALDTVTDVIKNLDAGLAKAPIDFPVVTYRYSSAEPMFTALQSGDVFVDKAFTSTTIDKTMLELKPVTFTITSPAGTKIGAIPSAYETEKEMLLGRGTSFRIDSREEDADGNIHFSVTVVGQQ